MKKNKIIKLTYYGLIFFSVFIAIFLTIKPLKHLKAIANYDATGETKIEEMGNSIVEIIEAPDESIIKLRIFLDKEKKVYDNLNISLTDDEGNEVFNVSVDEYTVEEMIFDTPILKKGKYILKIVDKDGESIRISTAKSDSSAYLENDTNKTLQLITYHVENNYFALWYPLFLMAFLISIYPFVRGELDEK